MNAGAAMFTGFNAPTKKKCDGLTFKIWTCSVLDVCINVPDLAKVDRSIVLRLAFGHILFFNWLVLGNLLWDWLLGCFGCFVIGWLLWSWLLGRLLWLLWGWLLGR